MSDQPDLSTLPQRMRYAADAINEFNKLLGDLYNSDCHWRPSELRREAGHLEAEEREAAERDALVEELASDWFCAMWPGWTWDDAHEDIRLAQSRSRMTAPEIPTFVLGICDDCRSIQTFTSERARELWEKHHGHQEDYGDE